MAYSHHIIRLFAFSLLGVSGCFQQRPDTQSWWGSAEDLCGPCGSLDIGQYTISHDVRLDGFFRAVTTFSTSLHTVTATLDREVLALAEVFGHNIDGAVVDAEYVRVLLTSIKGSLSSFVDGEITISYIPPVCSASLAVAADALAACEVSAACDVDGSHDAELDCAGRCLGSCSGTCSGEFACAVKGSAIACGGLCEGSCVSASPAPCAGTCQGTCIGKCSLFDSDGNCVGSCDGLCDGLCELPTAASCGGNCTGTCLVDPTSPACAGEVSCRGTCDGGCFGTCQGSFQTVASADCQASEDCRAQATAQAQANLECSAPVIEFVYALRPGLTVDQQIEFVYKLEQLKRHATAALQAGARVQAMLTGEVDGVVVFAPPPFEDLQQQLNFVLQTGIEGDYDIPAGRLPCVIPAFEDAIAKLTEAGSGLGRSVAAYAEFSQLFTDAG